MANTTSRYSGTDSTPWVIKDTTGKRVGSESYTSFKEASDAAEAYTTVSGEFASAVRA